DVGGGDRGAEPPPGGLEVVAGQSDPDGRHLEALGHGRGQAPEPGLDAGPGSGDAVDRLAQYHDGPGLLDLRLVRTALTDDLRGPVPELIGSPTAQVVQDELLRQGDRIGGGEIGRAARRESRERRV